MRAAVVTRFGPAAEVVRVRDYEPPALGAGAVAVRMLAAAINPSDLVTVSGAYASRTELPLVPGFEGVGRVCGVGPGVTTVAVGDRVLPIGSAGAWQQVKTTEARWCFRVLPDLTDEQAALSYINPLTAVRMVSEFALPRGAPAVAVNAAGSAIGGMLARLLNRHGIRPVALVRGDADGPGTAGPEWAGVLSTREPGWERELIRLTGGGPEIGYDAVGGAAGDVLIATLRPGGSLVHYGLLSGRPLSARRPDVSIVLYRLRDWVHRAGHGELQSALDEAGRLVLDGTAASTVQGTFPLDDVRSAILTTQRSGGRGKVLLLP
ncbi:zinc-dependent alcohol dehydrogenase family protein [Nocardia arthritidis]|nr:zinc-dependent alcohol dehydrogenase family protein [Nocardia arthritidis]